MLGIQVLIPVIKSKTLDPDVKLKIQYDHTALNEVLYN
jgi:hypothetical protein